jgi:hypothetical protein
MAGTLHRLIDERFGVPTRPIENPEITTATTALRKMLRANPERLGFTIFNLHATAVIFFGPFMDPSATKGFRLGPGGSAGFIFDEDFGIVGREWNILSDTVNSAIFIEGIEASPGEVR